jgi:hypothetical protein
MSAAAGRVIRQLRRSRLQAAAERLYALWVRACLRLRSAAARKEDATQRALSARARLSASGLEFPDAGRRP